MYKLYSFEENIPKSVIFDKGKFHSNWPAAYIFNPTTENSHEKE